MCLISCLCVGLICCSLVLFVLTCFCVNTFCCLVLVVFVCFRLFQCALMWCCSYVFVRFGFLVWCCYVIFVIVCC